MTLTQLLATFDRCDRDRQPITPSMWDALLSLAGKAERDRDAAAATERARVARIIRGMSDAYREQHGGGGDYCRALADALDFIGPIESNAHHEATK